MIPLVSTLCQGPLGVAQLPRLWWKNLLHQAGQLDEDYPFCSGGLDKYVLEVLRIDQDSALQFLWDQRPTYLQFEEWVTAEGTYEPNRIARWNESLVPRTHYRPDKIDETYGDIGWAQEETTEVSAVLLNCLQDWHLFHSRVFARVLTPDAPGLSGPVAPTLSSIDRGPLGICQLPRTWLKTCLRARGWLHLDYPDCAEGSLDQRCLQTLQVDQDAALAFLREEMPTYLAFEDWVRQEGTIEKEVVAAFNQRLLEREHNAAKQAEIHATLQRPPTWTSGVLLNHLEDWHYAHQGLVGG